MNEYWNGTHNLTGEVIVPEDLTLTVAGGTEILCRGSADTEVPPGGLVVEPGGSLVHQSPAEYKRSDGWSGYWNGITLIGAGNFNGITVSDAIRGLVISPDSSPGDIDGCNFSGNRTGLHIFKDGTVVNDCVFKDNLYYGIKEDGGASPVVAGCDFSGNGHDYYDTDLTVIGPDELNGMGSNSGNTGEEN